MTREEDREKNNFQLYVEHKKESESGFGAECVNISNINDGTSFEIVVIKKEDGLIVGLSQIPMNWASMIFTKAHKAMGYQPALEIYPSGENNIMIRKTETDER